MCSRRYLRMKCMLSALKPFTLSVYDLLSHIFMNSLQTSFTRALCSVFRSRCHLPIPLLLSFHPCFSLSVPVIDLDTECRGEVTKLLFGLPFKIPFLWGRVGIEIYSVVMLRRKGESDSSSIWRRERYIQ